jgi:hypothetical protein
MCLFQKLRSYPWILPPAYVLQSRKTSVLHTPWIRTATGKDKRYTGVLDVAVFNRFYTVFFQAHLRPSIIASPPSIRSGTEYYTPSNTIYTYAVSNFAYDHSGYREVINSIRTKVSSVLSEGAAYRNLASNLLYWMTWSNIVTQESTSGTQRLEVCVFTEY